MKRFPWLKMRKKTEPELPLQPPMWFGNQSNGEYFHFATQRDRKTRKLILERADENARRIGIDRRDFLASAMGMVTTLFVLNEVSACSSSGKSSSGGGNLAKDSGADAKYRVDPEGMYDEQLACHLVGGNEFIFDIQTHWFSKEDISTFPAYLNSFPGLFDLTTEDNYILDIFCKSDTSMVALSAWPSLACTGTTTTNCGLPLSNATNVASRDRINGLVKGTKRVLSHCQIMAQDANGIDGQLQIMEQMAQSGIAAWKLYPGFILPEAFTMDDPRGRAVIEKGIALGVPLFCVHKGLPIGPFFDTMGGNHPREIGVVAKDYPQAKFIIYHSAITTGYASTNEAPPEGPFDPSETDPKGTNALIRSLIDNGIGPNQNVYAEVGSALNQVLKDPTVAAHFFGKLMKYVGTDNVCWGTDCIIYGSPQQFIEPFRKLSIPQSMQDQFGYPPLDDAQKAKIFGLNAAKPYGVDPDEKRCKLESCGVEAMRQRMDEELGPRRWVFDQPNGPKTHEEYIEQAEASMKLGRPG